MSRILPYQEKICLNGGSFITPYGTIIPAYGKHEKIAKNYCEGEMIEKPESGLEFLYPKPLLYRESQLTHQQVQDLMLWRRVNSNEYDEFWSDFLVFCLGFDKAGMNKEKVSDDEQYIDIPTITSASNTPHIRFYNYYLMDWRIDILPKEIYHPETDQFRVENKLGYLDNYADMEAADEIEHVKQFVKKKEDRPLFFK